MTLELRIINQEIAKLAQAISDGVDNSILIPRSKELAEKLKKCESQKKYFLEEEKTKNKIDTNKISEFFLDFKNVIKNGDFEQQHRAITSFLKQIIVDPNDRKVYLEFFELPSELLVTTSNGAPKL
jgi:hypothetical protein